MEVVFYSPTICYTVLALCSDSHRKVRPARTTGSTTKDHKFYQCSLSCHKICKRSPRHVLQINSSSCDSNCGFLFKKAQQIHEQPYLNVSCLAFHFVKESNSSWLYQYNLSCHRLVDVILWLSFSGRSRVGGAGGSSPPLFLGLMWNRRVSVKAGLWTGLWTGLVKRLSK